MIERWDADTLAAQIAWQRSIEALGDIMPPPADVQPENVFRPSLDWLAQQLRAVTARLEILEQKINATR